MATRKTTQTNYFGNLKTPAANFANSSGINVFDAVSKGAATAQKGMPQKPRYTQQELESMRAENVVAQNLDDSPQIDWASYQSIPSDITSGWNNIIQDLGAQIGYEKNLQQGMSKTDYMGRSSTANNINNMTDVITTKIPQQLATLNEMYADFDGDYMDGLMSDMMDPKDKELISDIMHGKIKPEMDSQGNITFNGRSVNDLPQYHNKDIKTGAMLTKNLTGAFDRGKKLTEGDIALQRVNIANTLNEGGIPSILSVGFEDVMGFGTPLLDQSQYQDQIADLRSGDPMRVREAKQTISNAITEEYLAKLNQQANDGFNAKQPKDNIETGGYTGRELYQYSNFKSTVDLFKGLNEDNSNAANKISAIMSKEYQGRVKFDSKNNAIYVDSNLKDPQVYPNEVYKLDNETDLRRFLMLMGVPNYMISQNPELMDIFSKQENENVNTQPGSTKPIAFDKIMADIDQQNLDEEAKKKELMKRSFENFQKNLMKERESVASSTYVAPRKQPIITNIPKTYK